MGTKFRRINRYYTKSSETCGRSFKKIGRFWEDEASRKVLFTERELGAFTGGKSLEELDYKAI